MIRQYLSYIENKPIISFRCYQRIIKADKNLGNSVSMLIQNCCSATNLMLFTLVKFLIKLVIFSIFSHKVLFEQLRYYLILWYHYFISVGLGKYGQTRPLHAYLFSSQYFNPSCCLQNYVLVECVTVLLCQGTEWSYIAILNLGK